MDSNFSAFAKKMDAFLKKLLEMPRLTVADASQFDVEPGVYLITEGSKHLYVGRTKNVRQRLRQHGGLAPESSTFAFRLACDDIGWTTNYRRGKGRKSLMNQPEFRKAFGNNVKRIRNMNVRFVKIESDEIQHLLEFYVHVALKTPHNSWATH